VGRVVSTNDFEHPEEQARVAEILAGLNDHEFPMVRRIPADGEPAQVAGELARCVAEALGRIDRDGCGWLDRRFFVRDPVLSGPSTDTDCEADASTRVDRDAGPGSSATTAAGASSHD
jgi:hypothetical protein